MIDLHVHSSASDGSHSVKELIDFAVKYDIKVLALCDHDTTSGLEYFIKYAKDKNIRAIPGVELSAIWDKGNCHIIGLNVTNNYEPLESVLKKIRGSRNDRNNQITGKLNNLGIDISLDEVTSLAGGEVIARPHIARVMLNKGYVSTVKEAFDKYLAKRAPAYVDRFRLKPEKAVSILKEAESFVLLAHPSQLQLTYNDLDKFVKNLIPHGLSGIEVYTPYCSDLDIKEFVNISEKYSLKITGGSDFHGESKPDHKIGYYRKDKTIPDWCADI